LVLSEISSEVELGTAETFIAGSGIVSAVDLLVGGSTSSSGEQLLVSDQNLGGSS